MSESTKYSFPGTESYSSELILADDFCQQLQKRVKSESFTVNFKEYVGIDQHDEGCDFEVELQGELNQAPKVCIFDSFYI